MQIDAGDVSFVVINPDDGSPVSASQIRDATSGEFTSELYGLLFTIAPNPSKEEEGQDWVLILGACLGGALLLTLVVLLVVT